MAFLNRRAEGARKEAHLNWMGGPSYRVGDPLLNLRIAAATCFFGEPMYYHTDPSDTRARRHRTGHGARSALTEAQLAHLRETLGEVAPREWAALSPAALMESAIDAALAADPEATLAEAVRLRGEEHVRTTPQVILVRAANHPAVRGTGLVRRYAGRIMRRADEPAVALAYQLERFGRPIPNALKRALKEVLEGFDEYALAKYRMTRRQVKLVDVVNLVHATSAPIERLMRGELSVAGRTWEAIVSERGSTPEAWGEGLRVMGHTALRKNLRNLVAKGADPRVLAERLVEGARTGKALPFEYYGAYRALEAAGGAPPVLLDAVEEALVLSLGNLPRFGGRVMSLADNSGSAWGTTQSAMGTMEIATIANLTAVLTGRVSEEGYAGVFGDRLETMPIRQRGSVFDQVRELERAGRGVGGATENGIWLFWDRAIRQREHWDTVFVFSDMQAGHGGLYGTDSAAYRDFIWKRDGSGMAYIDVPKLIARYRASVNPRVRVFLVQVAGYQDTLVPEFYHNTYVLGGWGPGLLRFAAEVSRLVPDAQAE